MAIFQLPASLPAGILSAGGGSVTLSASAALGSCALSIAAPTVTLSAAIGALGTCVLSITAPTVTLSAAAALGTVTLTAGVGELVGV